MAESRNKREGWYAGKHFAKGWGKDWDKVWFTNHVRTRNAYRKLFKPKHILLTLSCTELGRIENFRFISSEVIMGTNQIR